jgi:tRNA A37 threonylcarbamoyladenosine biosynthesis protein TsaE
MDTWRLSDEQELDRSGFAQHLKKGNIVVIEWADKFYQEIQDICTKSNIPMYKITFKYISLEQREIKIYGTN